MILETSLIIFLHVEHKKRLANEKAKAEAEEKDDNTTTSHVSHSRVIEPTPTPTPQDREANRELRKYFTKCGHPNF